MPPKVQAPGFVDSKVIRVSQVRPAKCGPYFTLDRDLIGWYNGGMQMIFPPSYGHDEFSANEEAQAEAEQAARDEAEDVRAERFVMTDEARAEALEAFKAL